MASKQVGFFCDGCSVTPIVGSRYHCLTCDDFDLCESCYHKSLASGTHFGNDHEFVNVLGTIPSTRPIVVQDNIFSKDSATRAPFAVCGLVADGLPLPLLSVECTVRAHDYIAEVRVTQTYGSVSGAASAMFLLPQNDKVLIENVEIVCGDMRVTSHIREKSEVDAFHSASVARGSSAYILQETEQETLGITVGSLETHKPITASWTMLLVLSNPHADPATITLSLPSWLTHALVSGGAEKKGDNKDESSVRVDLQWDLSQSVSELVTDIDLDTVEYPTDHAVHAVYHSDRALRGPLQLSVRLRQEFGAILTLEATRGGASGDARRLATLLTVVPSDKIIDTGSVAVPPPREFVILVDQSESMKAEGRMSEAVYFAQLLLRGLPHSTPSSPVFVNVVGFGNDHASLWERSRSITKASVASASRYISEMEPNRGGTELLRPLAQILASSRPQLPVPLSSATSMTRSLFVLTDTEALDSSHDLISLVRQHREDWRVFAIGFGNTVSRLVIEGLARAGCGESTVILPGDRGDIRPRARHMVQTALQTKIESVSLGYGAATPGLLVQVPQRLPPMYANSPYHVLGIFDPAVAGVKFDGSHEMNVVVRGRPVLGGTRTGSRTGSVDSNDTTTPSSRAHSPAGSVKSNSGVSTGAASPAPALAGDVCRLTDRPGGPRPNVLYKASHPVLSTRHQSLDTLPHLAVNEELMARPLCKLVDWYRILDLTEGCSEYTAVQDADLTQSEIDELFREEVIKVAVQSQLPSRYTACASRLHTRHVLVRDSSSGGLFTGIGDSLAESSVFGASFGNGLSGSISGTTPSHSHLMSLASTSVLSPSNSSLQSPRAHSKQVLGPLYVYCDQPVVLAKGWDYVPDFAPTYSSTEQSAPISMDGGQRSRHHRAYRSSDMLSASLTTASPATPRPDVRAARVLGRGDGMRYGVSASSQGSVQDDLQLHSPVGSHAQSVLFPSSDLAALPVPTSGNCDDVIVAEPQSPARKGASAIHGFGSKGGSFSRPVPGRGTT